MGHCMFVIKSLLLLFLAAVLVGEGGLGGYVTARNVLIFFLKLTVCASHIRFIFVFLPKSLCLLSDLFCQII